MRSHAGERNSSHAQRLLIENPFLFPGCSGLRSAAIKFLLEVKIPLRTRYLLLIVAFGHGAIPLKGFYVIGLARVTASGRIEAHLQTPHVETEDLVMFAGACWGC